MPAGCRLFFLTRHVCSQVYWEGCDEWFDTKVLGHRAVLIDGKLNFKHMCEYDGGYMEHDLGVCDFEVLERATAEALPPTPAGEGGYSLNYSPESQPKSDVASPAADQENAPAYAPNVPRAPAAAKDAKTPKGLARKGHFGLRRARPRASTYTSAADETSGRVAMFI